MEAPLLTPTLLARPARFSARALGRIYLQRVLQEAHRVEVLGDTLVEAKRLEGLGELQADPEAVHDLRIALRRLRGWLRAWRPFLQDTVGKNSERRLRSISKYAGRTRDLEVAYAWLADSALRRTRLATEAAEWLGRAIAIEHRRALRLLGQRLAGALPAAAEQLERELRDYRVEIDPRRPESNQAMAGAIAALLEEHAARLPRQLARVRHAGQVEAGHAARIAIKRLRYLLDALGPSSRLAVTAGKPLSKLQDLLGDLHDLQLLARRLSVRPRTGTQSVPARQGIPALRVALRARTTAQFREVRRAVRSDGVKDLVDTVERLARRLRKESR